MVCFYILFYFILKIMIRRIHLVIVACVLSLGLLPQTAWAQLTADFTFTPGSPICPNTLINFTDQSTGGVTSWSWDFGTAFGGTSTAQNATFSYWQVGTYTVTLTVSDGVNTASTTQTLVVDGPDFDHALYDMTPTFSNCGSLTSTVTYAGNLNGTWVWDMGDGTTYQGGTNFTHTYGPGWFNNSITISDSTCTQTFWLDSVAVGTGLCLEGVVTDLSCNPPTLGSIDLTVIGGTAPYAFSWSNGATTEDLSGLQEGSYTVTVTDANGQTGVETFTIDNSLIDLDFVVGQTDCSGTGGSLDLTITGGAAPYTITWSTGATNTTSLTNLDAGGYSVTVADANGCTDHDPVFVTYEDSCLVNVSGQVYIDNNQNCSFDAGVDVPISHWVDFNSGSNGAYSNPNGHYSIDLPAGPITASLWSGFFGIYSYYSVACPVGNLHDLPFQEVDTTGLDFVLQADTSIHDLMITQQLWAVRPGFVHPNLICIRNIGTETVSPVVTWTHDSLIQFQSATPAPSSYDPNTQTGVWNLPPLGPLQTICIDIDGYLDPSVPLGTIVTNTASVASDPSETVLQDNVDTTEAVVVGSYDPNDKQATPAGTGRSGLIDEDTEWFTYRIRFQNTGTDTAFYVTIRDTLDADFLPYSVETLGSSHPYELTIDKGGAMRFFFDWILLPDSGTNLEASQGYVLFRVKRREGMQPGEQLTNTAAIYFDFNAPIITNTTVNTLMRTVSVQSPSEAGISLYPNPTHSTVWVESDRQAIERIDLLTPTGRRVLEQPGQGQARQSVDVSRLPVGLYLMRVITPQGQSLHKLLIQE